jgi:hypothetical protein
LVRWKLALVLAIAPILDAMDLRRQQPPVAPSTVRTRSSTSFTAGQRSRKPRQRAR